MDYMSIYQIFAPYESYGGKSTTVDLMYIPAFHKYPCTFLIIWIVPTVALMSIPWRFISLWIAQFIFWNNENNQ